MIKEGFVLRRLPGMNIVMPSGARVKEFKGALVLNDAGAFIFEELQRGKSVEAATEALLQEYEVSEQKAREDVLRTIASLTEAGLWTE